MSEVDELDELRARAIAVNSCNVPPVGEPLATSCDIGGQCLCLRDARAIREAETAAGYITAKLEGVANEKDRKG